SSTSSSPAMTQTYESGGSFSEGFWAAIGRRASVAVSTVSRSARALITVSLCYTFAAMKGKGLILAIVVLAGLRFAEASRSDEACAKFWAAADSAQAASRADEIAKSGVGFDEAYRILRAGRTYAAQSTGLVRQVNKTLDGVEHFYVVNVPDAYDPARAY